MGPLLYRPGHLLAPLLQLQASRVPGRMEVGDNEGGAPLISLISDIPNCLALESEVQTSTRAREQMVLSPPSHSLGSQP